MADLDSNAWYRLSQTRVDNSTGPFALNLQLRDVGLRVHPVADGTAAWQFQPVGDVKGRYLMRLDKTGVKQQLGVCFDATEPAPGNTVACLRTSSIDTSQQWDISDFGSGTFKFVNVANGTKYVLDVHPQANLFMSDAIEGTPGVAENQLAQHWVMSSVKAVNDGAYSTIYSGNVAVSTKSATLSSSTGTSATSTTQPTTLTALSAGVAGIAAVSGGTSTATATPATTSRGISTAAGAGIGVAVALSVVGLIGAVAFWWWRRSQRPSKPKYSEVEAKNGDAPERGSSIGVSPLHESAPSSLHGVSPVVGTSNLSSWQPASSISVPPASAFVNGQQMNMNVQQAGYFNQQQPGVPVAGQQGGYYVDPHQQHQQHQQQQQQQIQQQQLQQGQQVGYYDAQQQVVPTAQQPYVSEQSYVGGQDMGPSAADPREAAYSASQQAEAFANADGPIASLYGQRIRSINKSQSASLYGRGGASPTTQSSRTSLYGQQNGSSSPSSGVAPRHQFDHPTAPGDFAPAAPDASGDTLSAGKPFSGGNSQSQTSSTVNLADFEPMPQPHELEAAERDIVRRQHELGTLRHGPNFTGASRSRKTDEQATKMLATPKAELSAYQHGPDTFSQNEAKMLGMPTAELGAYQHGPDDHEAKVLGSFHPGTDTFIREREDKVLGSFHDIMNAKPSARNGPRPDGEGAQSFEMGPIRPPAR